MQWQRIVTVNVILLDFYGTIFSFVENRILIYAEFMNEEKQDKSFAARTVTIQIYL